MRLHCLVAVWLSAAVVAFPVAAHGQPACPFEQLARGEQSGYRLGDPAFLGADLVIRNLEAWHAFWARHTSHLPEPPPPPPVAFERVTVLAAIQGPHGAPDGPGIAIVRVTPLGHTTVVSVVEHRQPGPPDPQRNPFHIVAVPNECFGSPSTSIAFVRHLPPPPGAIVGRVMGVTPEEPVPLAGALVRLFHGDRPIRETHTDEDGFYHMPEVPPGEHRMVAIAEGFMPQEAPVEVISGEVTEQNFLLHPIGPPGEIVGRVMGVTPEEPVPLAGALVRLFHGDRPIRETHTDEDGFYHMPEVPPGEHRMVAVAEGFMPQEAPVEVISGEVTEQNFLLHPMGPPGEIVGRVMGVTPEEPVPLAGALVRLFHGDRPIRETHTDEDGFYHMPEVPPGEHWMVAAAEGYRRQGAAVEVISGEVTERNFLLHPAEAAAADGDADGVELGDEQAFFEACFSGSDSPVVPGCESADLDADGDADCDDWDLFQQTASPAEYPALSPCDVQTSPAEVLSKDISAATALSAPACGAVGLAGGLGMLPLTLTGLAWMKTGGRCGRGRRASTAP